MEQLHNRLLILIEEIDEICKKYNIVYYAAGGTVIGAVRHGGFIPWDDDIDIYMTRDDFYLFRKAFKAEKKENRALGCLDDNPLYPGTVARYIDVTTTVIGKFNCLGTCEAGVLIDIFILDPVPQKEIRKYLGKLMIYSDLVMPYYVYTNRADEEYLCEYKKYIKRARWRGRKKLIYEIEKEIFSYDEFESDVYILRWGTVPHIFEKEMFAEPVYLKFENISIPVPTNWYKYLVQLYGINWTDIPDGSERDGHSILIDLDRSYKEYFETAHKLINLKKALSIYRKRKSVFIKKEMFIRPFREMWLKRKSEYILQRQKTYLKENNINIFNLSSEKDFEGVVNAYNYYLKFQLDRQYIGRMKHADIHRFLNKIFIPLADDMLIVLIKSLLMCSRIDDANKLLLLRRDYKVLTNELSQISDYIEKIYDTLDAFYKKDFKVAEENLNELSKTEYKDIYYLKTIDLSICISNNRPFEIIKNKLAEIRKHRGDGKYFKMYGDFYFYSKEYALAELYYKKALKYLKDGIYIKDICNKTGESVSKKIIIKPVDKSALENERYQLISEIHSICEKNGISYFVLDKNFIYKYYQNQLNENDIPNRIVMKPGDALKFINICENSLKSNRVIEYTLNNYLHNEHTISYGNTNTLDFNILKSDTKCNLGIHIDIYILKSKGKKVLRYYLTRMLDILQSINNYLKYNAYILKPHILSTCIHRIIKLIGEKRLAEFVFCSYMKMALENSDKAYYLSKKNYRRSVGEYYDKSYFTGKKILNIYGCKYCFPIYMDMFVKNEIKEEQLKKKSKTQTRDLPIYRVIDGEINIDNFLQNINLNNLNGELLINYKKGIALNKKIRMLNKKRKQYWDIFYNIQKIFCKNNN